MRSQRRPTIRPGLRFLAVILLVVGGFDIVVPAASAADAFEAERLEMVREYLIKEGITNRRVIKAVETVPRHEFIRPSFRKNAYQDLALPIGYRQTISPPFIVAYMTETLDPQPTDRVLEIGTGSGYQAAVLSELVAEVYTIEIVDELSRNATRTLHRLHYDNVHTRAGDGYLGWPEEAPFDKIIVTCSPENVPRPLVEQLREGGRMIVPLGERYQQVFYLFEKVDGMLVQKRLIPTLFVPMTGKSEEARQVKPDPSHPTVVNGSFEIDENEDGRTDNWHYQRNVTLMEGDAADGQKFLRFENGEPGELSQLLQGMAVDGLSVAGLKIGISVRSENAMPGPDPTERPALVIHFYDNLRNNLGDAIVGPFVGSSGWRHYSRVIPVPNRAREAIIRIGLNGGVGRLDIDHVTLTPVPQ